MAEDKGSSMVNKVDHKSDQPCELSHEFLKRITNNFDETLIVGRGAFGTVYKGTCENGEQIAVKVLKNMTGFDNKEFRKEFENLRRLKHQNIIELVGFCNESEKVVVEYKGKQVLADEMHTALCFEYVCNGSLAKHVSADGCSGLNWHILYKIIKGICQGLEYLRHGLKFAVWHLDLKPANILLDNNMIPKLADFGLSRLLGEEFTRKTINLVGTGGYLPPEYIEHGLLTKEFDIFSLGVIIAKLIAGSEVYSEIDSMSEKKFINHVHDNWRKKLSETLAPRRLEVYCAQVRTCIQIALKCMNCKRQERPTIQFIISNLIRTEIMICTRGLQTEQNKVVLMLDLHDDNQKQKAFKAVGGLPGIDMIGVDMKQQNMTIVGTVDPIAAVSKLRRIFPTPEFVSVGPVQGNKKQQQQEERLYLPPVNPNPNSNLICWPNTRHMSNTVMQ